MDAMADISALRFDVATVTLNPAIDRTLIISDFAAGAVNRVERFEDSAGGKGVNVASALAENGHRVAATGFLGQENAGLFESLFADRQISDQFVRIEGNTRVGIKIFDPVQRTTTDINFPGPSPAPEAMARLTEKILAMDAPWFVLGGSLPPGCESWAYRDFVAKLRAKGHKIVVDTSNEALRHAIEAQPTIIKPNIHELEALLGKKLQSEQDVVTAVRSLVNQGIELVVVSMGKQGACFADANRVVIARPPDIDVRSTVGAGDAMVAGIVSAQIRGLSLEDCARVATAFSVRTLTGAKLEQIIVRITHC